MTATTGQRKLPLVHANLKLGYGIWHFSLPAGITCPGETEACAAECYAKKGTFLFPTTVTRLAENDAMRLENDFVPRVTAQITLQMIRRVRVHAAGDFDTIDYIRKWRRIAMRKQDTTYWAYTRSWTEEAAEAAGENLVEELILLNQLDQFHLWLSCDKDTGKPRVIPGARLAYMSTSDDDRPDYQVDMVFRTDRRTKLLSASGGTVCPAERETKRDANGKRVKSKVTCANCQLCFDRVKQLDKLNAKIRERSLAIL